MKNPNAQFVAFVRAQNIVLNVVQHFYPNHIQSNFQYEETIFCAGSEWVIYFGEYCLLHTFITLQIILGGFKELSIIYNILNLFLNYNFYWFKMYNPIF